MKRGEPFNVLRDRNSWSENPRAEAIAVSLFSGGLSVGSTAAAAWLGTTAGMLAVTGVSIGLSLVTSWAVAALTPQPPTPKQSILVNGRDAAAPQDFIYGTVRKGGTITYYESTRGGSVLHQIIVLAGHEVDDIVEVYANDEVLELSDDSYDFNGRTGAGWVLNRNWIDKDDGPELRVLYHTGNQTAITDPFANSSTDSLSNTLFEESDEGSANFGGTGQPTKESFVGTGIAYLYIRYSYNAGVFKNGLPLFTAKIKGRPVYDPRTDTTAWSDNAALCIRDFITNAYGLGDPQVDDTAFSVAANICDETVALAAGGTEKRYTINGVVRADQSYGDVLQEMTTACAGTLFWGTGKWKLHVGAYTAPVKDFTPDDIRSNISLQTRVNLRDQFNKVQGVFTDAGSDYIPVDYPPIESETFKAQDNGVEQVLDLDLPFTTSAAAAQRLAKLTLFRGREQMSFTADFGLSAFEVEVGDIISLTMPRYGWEAKEFEVVGWVFGADDAGALRISLTLRETSEAAFDWDAEESEIVSNDSNLTSDINPVTNLTATAGGTVARDGTFINSILVDWDAPDNASGYDIEWMVNTSIDYVANGGIVEPADAVTTREQFIYKAYVEILYRQPDGDGFDFYNTGGGSSLTEEQLRAQLFESSERTALAFSGSSVRNPTTEFTITPVRDETEYNIRVRAFNDLGDQSEWTSVTFTSVTDGTVPNAPANLTATGGYRTVRLAWDAPTQNTNGSDLTDLALYNIYRGLSANPTTKVASTAGEGWTDSGLDDSTTYHYRVTARDFSGNESAYSLNASVTTNPELVDGADGASVLVVYADDAGGSNQSLSAGSRRYVQYYEYTGATPSLPVPGTFVLFVGDDGVSIWPIYADDAAGNGQSFSPTGKGYVTFYESATQPTLPVSGQTFVKYVGDDGGAGARGPGRWYIDIDPTVYDLPITASQADDAWNAVSGSNGIPLRPSVYDQVIFYEGTQASPTRQQAFICTAVSSDTIHTWAEQIELIDGSLLVTGTVTADSLVVGNTSQGIQINGGGKDDAVYVYQNSQLIYGIYAINGFDPNLTQGAGGVAYFESLGGFTVEINNTENNFSTDDAALFAQNSASGGGAVWLGESGLDGGYGVNVLRGGYYDTSGDGYLPFTGSHEAMVLRTETLEVGDIVCDHTVIAKSISDTFTEVRRSTAPNMPSAVGVYKGPRSSGWGGIAAFVDKAATAENSALPAANADGEKINRDRLKVYNVDWSIYEADYAPILINAVGEGSINVCGENGNIAVGDLIVTSSTPGKGMKQGDDIVRSYTVAKAREAVTFDSPGDIKMVACIYLCG